MQARIWLEYRLGFLLFLLPRFALFLLGNPVAPRGVSCRLFDHVRLGLVVLRDVLLPGYL